ncbi:MAG: hypothetical protein WC707_00070 [Candidatus Babeliaceae bacterium]|jgi:hypothetical protein
MKSKIIAVAVFLCLAAASLQSGIQDYQNIYERLVGVIGNHTAFAAMYEKRRHAIENDPRPRCISVLLYDAMDQRSNRAKEKLEEWQKRVADVREQGNSFQKATADFEWLRLGAACATITASLGLVAFCASNVQDRTLLWCMGLLIPGATFFICDALDRIASAMNYERYLYEEWRKTFGSYSVLRAEFVAREMYYDRYGHIRAKAENVRR